MADFVYNDHKHRLGQGNVNYASEDMRLILVMGSTTFDTEDDITTLGGVTTPDYFDGANHDTTNGHALDSEAWAKDASNDRSEFDAADEVLSALGAGSGNVVATILYEFDTDRDSSHPVAYLDHTDFNGNGGDVTYQFNSEGILQIS